MGDYRWLKNSIVYLIILIAALAILFSYTDSNSGSSFYWYYFFIISFMMLLLFFLSSYKRLPLSKVREKYPKLSVVGIMLRRNNNNSTSAITILGVLFAISAVFRYYFGFELVPYTTAISFAVTLLMLLQSQIFNFRVGAGYYGSNEYEAREIISFIANNSDNIDFTDGGKSKKIFTEEDLREINTQVERSLKGAPQPK